MIYTIEQIKNKSKEVFDKQDFVKEAYLFGSYARGEATEKSDIDFMIVLNRAVGMEFFGLYHFLQKEFQKDVDVLTEKEAYDIMPESIERDKVKIYGDE
ncbi:MAG TPA: nucleotidyltransferase [Eubacterium sp.]|nr:nucleotidyltransferase [Eubacterium sp.]